MNALIAQYPGLSSAYDDATRGLRHARRRTPVEFHAAYIANLEATFTPLFKVVLDNRHSLFEGADRRVASLMMWHFVEEIEHRSSGLVLSRYLSPDRWYRVRRVRETFRHIGEVAATIAATVDAVVPEAQRGVSAVELMSIALLVDEFRYRGPGGARRTARRDGAPNMFHDVSTVDLTRMVWRLFLSQMPNHDPAHQPLPDWAQVWMAEYERGTDMTTFADVGTPRHRP